MQFFPIYVPTLMPDANLFFFLPDSLQALWWKNGLVYYVIQQLNHWRQLDFVYTASFHICTKRPAIVCRWGPAWRVCSSDGVGFKSEIWPRSNELKANRTCFSSFFPKKIRNIILSYNNIYVQTFIHLYEIPDFLFRLFFDANCYVGKCLVFFGRYYW